MSENALGRSSVLGGAYRYLGIILESVIGVLMVCMVLLVFSNVIARYFLNSAIAWSEEISRFFFIWIVFLGAAMAFVKNEHLGMDLVVKAIPRKASLVVMLIADLLVLYAIYLIATGGFQLTAATFESGWTSPASEVPYGFVYMVVPLCAVVLFIEGVLKFVANLRSLVIELKGGN